MVSHFSHHNENGISDRCSNHKVEKENMCVKVEAISKKLYIVQGSRGMRINRNKVSYGAYLNDYYSSIIKCNKDYIGATY